VERERITQLVERCLVFHWKARDGLPEATRRLQALGITNRVAPAGPPRYIGQWNPNLAAEGAQNRP